MKNDLVPPPKVGDFVTFQNGVTRYGMVMKVLGNAIEIAESHDSVSPGEIRRVKIPTITAINGVGVLRSQIVIDSREQSAELKAAADEVRLLSVPNPNDKNHPYSFDIQVATACGQVLTFERKTMMDAISSIGKIERQSSYCTGIICEWNEQRLQLEPRMEDPKFATMARSAKKRLWRLAHRQPVIFTSGLAETIEFIRYLRDKDELIEVRGPSLVNGNAKVANQ